jgi:hypothetical protein
MVYKVFPYPGWRTINGILKSGWTVAFNILSGTAGRQLYRRLENEYAVYPSADLGGLPGSSMKNCR